MVETVADSGSQLDNATKLLPWHQQIEERGHKLVFYMWCNLTNTNEKNKSKHFKAFLIWAGIRTDSLLSNKLIGCMNILGLQTSK
jgi:ABC-type molybdate transport system substrate-binding protein